MSASKAQRGRWAKARRAVRAEMVAAGLDPDNRADQLAYTQQVCDAVLKNQRKPAAKTVTQRT